VWSAAAGPYAEAVAFGVPGDATASAAISYLSEVELAPEIVYVAAPDNPQLGGVFFVIDPTDGTLNTEGEVASELAPFCGAGTPADPQAEPGYICVFASKEHQMLFADYTALSGGQPSEYWVSPDPESGVILPFSVNQGQENGEVAGSWAVNTE
jgi:hypothetical protein